MDTRGLLNDLPPPPAPGHRDDPVRAPWGLGEIAAAVLVTLGAFGVTSLMAIVALAALGVNRSEAESDPGAVTVLVLAQIALDICAVAAAYALSIGKFRLSLQAWGLRRERPVAVGPCVGVLVASFVALIAYTGIVNALGLEDLAPRQEDVERLLENRSVLPISAVLILGVAPVTEEMFFRGFLFNGLRRRLGVPGAAVASGGLFALIHFSGLSYVGLLIPFTAIGFMFAMLVARTGSLWNSIVVHMGFNSFSFVANLVGGPGGVLVSVVVLVMAFVALRLLIEVRDDMGRRTDGAS